MNILVSCAGGPAAVGVIKSIHDSDSQGIHKIVAIDCDELSVGFHLADRGYVVPFSVEDDFWKEVLKIIKKEEINLIVPTGDADIVHFARNKSMLARIGITNFMSDYETILNCQNKLNFYEEGKRKGLHHLFPKTSANWEDIEFPILCKPKRGSGSRGIELWENESQIKDFSLIDNLHYSSDYIYQEYLPGTEYTIDVFCDLDGNVLSVIPRERLQTKAGISSKGRIIRNDDIEKACIQLCKSFKVKGPVCIQMKDDISGHPIFVEMNPRFGGGTYFTTLAGVNFMKLMFDVIDSNKIEVPEPKEITVLRYYNEIVI
jgi:carbamoyl-phosphate synthase large subunit